MSDSKKDNQYDNLSELMEEQVVVDFHYAGNPRKARLVPPTIKQTAKVRQQFEEHVRQLAASEDEKSVDDMSQVERADYRFKIRDLDEQIAAKIVKICVPQLNNKSDQQMVEFIRKVGGGTNSPLVTVSRRLCGIDVTGSADAVF